jgi:hypothetical protein
MLMSLLDAMKKNNTILNTKGSSYYATTYDSNLDVFTMLSRYNSNEEIIRLFNNAMQENEELALANLLYILDIRNGKGERRIFKTIFKDLCLNNSICALRVLPLIGILGRYDYILEGIDTPIEDDVISLIKNQLDEDLKSDNPSLLAKWLPSHRTHNINSSMAKKIMNKLNMNEKEYRKTLSSLRNKLNIVEKNLSNKTYENIDFQCIPTKAMIKYSNAYNKRMPDLYKEYKNRVKNKEVKINTECLFAYEIIRNLLRDKNSDYELYDLMWNNQKDVLKGCNSNVLVMADTSGSMLSHNGIPYFTSIGMAIYTASRNSGIFKNHFITFSNRPCLCEIKGKTIKEKVKNIPFIVSNTNIDLAFELILNTAIENNIKQEELPSHLLIISDMEFDQGVYTKNGTNFEGWKQEFLSAGYILPKIIFWNVAGSTRGIPVTKFDNDVAMVSGFATNILDNLLNLENYSPTNIMLEKLSIYLEMLNSDNL